MDYTSIKFPFANYRIIQKPLTVTKDPLSYIFCHFSFIRLQSDGPRLY